MYVSEAEWREREGSRSRRRKQLCGKEERKPWGRTGMEHAQPPPARGGRGGARRGAARSSLRPGPCPHLEAPPAAGEPQGMGMAAGVGVSSPGWGWVEGPWGFGEHEPRIVSCHGTFGDPPKPHLAQRWGGNCTCATGLEHRPAATPNLTPRPR